MKLEQGISMPADSGSRSSVVDRDGAATFLSGRGQAWQRAMEQAEFAGWFKGPEDGRQSTGSAAASEIPPALRTTAGRSAPMPHYSLFESAQPARFLADRRDELSGAGSSRMSGDAGSTGYATGDERAQGLGNSSGTVSALAASLRGAVTSAVGSTVEFDVTMASPTGVMLASRLWPTAAVPSAANTASELVGEDGLTEAEVSPAPKAQGGRPMLTRTRRFESMLSGAKRACVSGWVSITMPRRRCRRCSGNWIACWPRAAASC